MRQALTKLDDFVVKLKKKIWRVDNDIQVSIRGQTHGGQEGQALEDAQEGMTELFSQIRDIKQKAELSEKMVQEITRDIKSLDYAKKHLTGSITTLNHLKMLVSGVDTLNTLVKQRLYRDVANLLAAVLSVFEHFEKYTEIERIKGLSTRITDLKRQLNHQITDEFQEAFARPEPDTNICDIRQLAEACLVLDVLGEDSQQKIVTWFVSLQLRDYKSEFHPSKGMAWIDNVDKRFVWLKKTLASYREHCSDIFPKEWHLPEMISTRFCEITRDELQIMLQDRRDQLEVKILLFALKKTTDFEVWLASRFPSREFQELEEEANTPAETEIEAAQRRRRMTEAEKRKEQELSQEKPRKRKQSHFIGLLTKIFDSYMGVYVEAQEKNLETMMEAFQVQFKAEGVKPADQEEGDEGGQTLGSSGDMFRFFRDCIVQCNELNSSKALHDLYVVFKKYLATYAQKILMDNIPKYAQLAQILLKDGDLKLSSAEQYTACCILNTAEYCLDTTAQLEGRLKQKIGEDLVDLIEEQDTYHEVITNCIQLLVRALETQCEAGLVLMTKTKWDLVEEVGDTSPYISQIGKSIGQYVPFVRSSLAASRKYFTNFTMKFVNSFIPRIISSIYKCSKLSTVAAEQLLLDMQSMRTVLLELPSFGSAVSKKPPASYTRFVTKSMMKAELILKVVMSPHIPPSLYVEDYMKMLGEDDGVAGFQKVLDMKGLKKAEIAELLEAYNKVAVTAAPQEVASSSKKGGGGKPADGAGGSKRSSIRKLERLMKRFQ
jgi:hypothetical protein